jgi:ribose 5-phosphate isomerase B
MKVTIASDHAGFPYKTILIQDLIHAGYEVIDLGTNSEAPTDYPDHAADLARAIQQGTSAKGILICGSAVGVSIAANKFKDIRAGVCHDTYSARQAVEHDDVNVLCMGERVIGIALAHDIVFTFLNAHFSNEARHMARLAKIAALEKENLK